MAGWLIGSPSVPVRASTERFLVPGGAKGHLQPMADETSVSKDVDAKSHRKMLSQTVSIRIDRFRSFWRGSPASARR